MGRFRGVWRGLGKFNAEAGAALGAGVRAQIGAVRRGDLPGDGQTQADAAFPLGEKRVEHPRPLILGDAGAVVVHVQHQLVPRLAGAHDDFAAARQNLQGVHEEIQQNLDDLLLVAEYEIGCRGEFRPDANGPVPGLQSEQIQDAPDDLMQPMGAKTRRTGSGAVQQYRNQTIQPIRFGQHKPQHSARAGDDPTSPWEYHLGHGYRLGDSGVTLGGYASAEILRPSGRSWSFQAEDISLFVTAEKGRWRFFSETEVNDALSAGNGEAFGIRRARFDAERLHLDYTLAEELKFRIGKFLTPVGRWNLIHADPLVWTTSRPRVTAAPFAPHATGVMAFGDFNALDREWNYSLYAGGKNQLDMKKPDESLDSVYRDTFGVRVVNEMPGRFQMGASYAHFEQVEFFPGSRDLAELDFFWTRNRMELSGEFAYRWSAGKDDWGLYLQGVAPLPLPLGENVYAIGRYEAFQREDSSRLANRWVAGLAYRPLPPLVFKVEYSVGVDAGNSVSERIVEGSPEGFAASVAVLF